MTGRCRQKPEISGRTGGRTLKTRINWKCPWAKASHAAWGAPRWGTLLGLPSQRKKHQAWVQWRLAPLQRAQSLRRTVRRLADYQLLFQHKDTEWRDSLAAHKWNNSSLPIQTEFSNVKSPVTSVCNLSVWNQSWQGALFCNICTVQQMHTLAPSTQTTSSQQGLGRMCLPTKTNTHLCRIPSWTQPKWSLEKQSGIPWFRSSLRPLQSSVDCG